MKKSKVVLRVDLPTCEVMHRNILAMLMRDCKEAEAQRDWYRRANRWCRRAARATGYSATIIASVAAVLSPNVEWRDNRLMTLALLRNKHATTFTNKNGNTAMMLGYPANIAKARKILTTNDPSYCTGPKVTAFRDAILGVRDYAVIDIHATNVAMGTENYYEGPGSCLHDIALAYESVATHIGWQVHEVQAAVWVIYKKNKPARRIINNEEGN